MRDLTIRPAGPDDLEPLTWQLGQDGYFADRLDRQSDHRGVLLTAWTGSLVIGVVYLWLEEAEEPEIGEHLPDTPLITHLEIHPEHRRKGVGTRLIETAEQLLAEQGCDKVALAVELTNEAAAKLYERLGYEKWPHPPVKCYSPGDHNGHRRVEICNVMVKPLAGDAGTCSGAPGPGGT